jgi:hypothetical protein
MFYPLMLSIALSFFLFRSSFSFAYQQAEINDTNFFQRSYFHPGYMDQYAPKVTPFKVDQLPEHVYFRDGRQGFSYEFYYALTDDGRIWTKPHTLNTGKVGPWKPFLGKGYPFGSKFKLDQNEKIVEFSTEGTMILALSNKRRFYKFQPTLERKELEWEQKMSTPVPEKLYLPANRAWIFSFSVSTQPEKRITPMHKNDIVHYWEDRIGNKIEFGLTATIYTLDLDGQLIRYWDTGLPGSFTRSFSTPERGRFVAENMSASASTLFVVDKGGRMFTYIFDYELNTGCPGLNWNYYKGKKTDKILPLFAPRVVPIEDWRRQPDIKLTGKAALTKHLSIHLTGQGNKARELRIAGLNSAGLSGFYHKMIDDSSWSFTPADFEKDLHLNIKITDILETSKPYNLTHLQGEKRDAHYFGEISIGKYKDLRFELRDFNPYHSPAIFRIYTQDGRPLNMLLHHADAWSPMVQNKKSPELVGKSYGSPQLMVGTLEIPPELLKSTDSHIASLIGPLRPLHLLTNAFRMAANEKKVALSNERWTRDTPYAYLDYSFKAKVRGVVENPFAREELRNGRQGLVNHSYFILDPKEKNSQSVIRQKIARNQHLAKWLKETDKELRKAHLIQSVPTNLFTPLFPIASAIINLTHQNKKGPIGDIVAQGDFRVRGNAEMNIIMLLATDDEKLAHEKIKARIEDYEDLLTR